MKPLHFFAVVLAAQKPLLMEAIKQNHVLYIIILDYIVHNLLVMLDIGVGHDILFVPPLLEPPLTNAGVTQLRCHKLQWRLLQVYELQRPLCLLSVLFRFPRPSSTALCPIHCGLPYILPAQSSFRIFRRNDA